MAARPGCPRRPIGRGSRPFAGPSLAFAEDAAPAPRSIGEVEAFSSEGSGPRVAAEPLPTFAQQ
eukprot:6090477-Lingulodinium_polyedra.AAC.1